MDNSGEAGDGQVKTGDRVTLRVKVQPNARRQEIRETGKHEYSVRVLAPPSEGKANKEVIKIIASHFQLPLSRVRIIKGQKSRQKLIVLER